MKTLDLNQKLKPNQQALLFVVTLAGNQPKAADGIGVSLSKLRRLIRNEETFDPPYSEAKRISDYTGGLIAPEAFLLNSTGFSYFPGQANG